MAKYDLPNGVSPSLGSLIDQHTAAERRLAMAKVARALAVEVEREAEARFLDRVEALCDLCVAEGGVPR